MRPLTRRALLAAGSAAAWSLATRPARAASPPSDVLAQVERRHDEALQRLRAWIAEPCIAAEQKGYERGLPFFLGLLRDAGFQKVERVATRGLPGVFATLDAGARRTLAVYFMYDVKQVDLSEWTSPPFEGRLVQRPELGTVMVGRGAVNQKGPEAAFLAALHAYRAAGRKPPVNLVLVGDGEEEIGSPSLPELVRRPDVSAALARCTGMVLPGAEQELGGELTLTLGAKGDVELELRVSGERWGRGAGRDVHSSNRARLDSPPFHLVQALSTLVTPDGADPAIDGFADAARPPSADELRMVETAARAMSEVDAKKVLGVKRWVRDADWKEALVRFFSRPTVEIEGIVGGYTGPGGKTVSPTRASAKLDLRLVPDMTAEGAIQAVRKHLEKRGFGDIEVAVLGGAYDPTSTPADAKVVRAAVAAYRAGGVEPLLWPRSPGSWPGYLFTGAPLKLGAVHFGVGHGGREHAPDEYLVVDSKVPRVAGYDRAVGAHVRFLEAVAA